MIVVNIDKKKSKEQPRQLHWLGPVHVPWTEHAGEQTAKMEFQY